MTEVLRFPDEPFEIVWGRSRAPVSIGSGDEVRLKTGDTALVGRINGVEMFKPRRGREDEFGLQISGGVEGQIAVGSVLLVHPHDPQSRSGRDR